ncbi:MAG: hypothetical protein A3H57_01555 [Candidatus Taylorbacteria bacterium RIFCSPLOWO2_02_FULL_43_11]|uniref:Type 4 fimbrial biogenesis protein PilX N-terminal domain-containing protein n=1 Tax=Candidatus Taylorbacteria bacterium RIFCSPHIGHO2_02_FULL_43_32b TaxID=1802306 RepID=A0A1G2MGN5_9BACT|nr:MAG: hypothetical protein A2743_02825 [Candidatus Taylorbacteria bacterium RIFCSPHIGHO2_01_FULL_43_47]OHA22162.1 MAG: hypothetical protein A3C72_02295 [Candidatus Taylorbacteria bacterium RIFCSPHIGHO2_02_FULL_43_32b]OHA28858.1 MAG: hypothetical protein A3B08_02065 [Candidatus Taylorbacteria bacterium RIFCSPLOWO2_01_FULL_43_44]OHA36060.1 MAG: hypothetical protein A3H57_01555 [Candidatus Taylorbacteria bacterium RIFCSPLOWO2_02_FULL_43_11]
MKFRMNKNGVVLRWPSSKAGFSLLFAVLISAMLITIGAAMANLSLREFDLVATVRQSQKAFYAADAGVECALFYDLQGNPHFKEPYRYDEAPAANSLVINCNESDIPVTVSPVNTNANNRRVTNTFTFDFEGACASVTVIKLDVINDGWSESEQGYPEPDGYNGNNIGTIIESRGWNVPCSGNREAIQVERALRVEY